MWRARGCGPWIGGQCLAIGGTGFITFIYPASSEVVE